MNAHPLTDALLDEERHLPDPAAVMAGVRVGIRRRRRRRLVSAGLAAVAAVALFLVVPRAEAPVADPPTATVHIRLAWLPDAVPADAAYSAGSAGESVTYGNLVGGPFLQATLDQLTGADETKWTETTVNGAPARYTADDRVAAVSWTLPSGRTARLTYGGAMNPLPPQDLQRDALRAAAGLRDDGTLVLRAAVVPTYIPEHYYAAGVDSSGGIYLTGQGGRIPDFVVALSMPVPARSPAVLPSEHSPMRVRDIQGLPAYITVGPTLSVHGFHGRNVTIIGDGDPRPSEEELIRIAEGLRWAGP
ncbi:hypothetical protein ABT369_49555 [Dactylosporangium sp. NPDC000244]|uniref:hypothetical protein n=1 Tax=Dactylosporangium sp. NPDC000244 TaxID=3154365 RepID=UPI0033167638